MGPTKCGYPKRLSHRPFALTAEGGRPTQRGKGPPELLTHHRPQTAELRELCNTLSRASGSRAPSARWRHKGRNELLTHCCLQRAELKEHRNTHSGASEFQAPSGGRFEGLFLCRRLELPAGSCTRSLTCSLLQAVEHGRLGRQGAPVTSPVKRPRKALHHNY